MQQHAPPPHHQHTHAHTHTHAGATHTHTLARRTLAHPTPLSPQRQTWCWLARAVAVACWVEPHLAGQGDHNARGHEERTAGEPRIPTTRTTQPAPHTHTHTHTHTHAHTQEWMSGATHRAHTQAPAGSNHHAHTHTHSHTHTAGHVPCTATNNTNSPSRRSVQRVPAAATGLLPACAMATHPVMPADTDTTATQLNHTAHARASRVAGPHVTPAASTQRTRASCAHCAPSTHAFVRRFVNATTARTSPISVCRQCHQSASMWDVSWMIRWQRNAMRLPR